MLLPSHRPLSFIFQATKYFGKGKNGLPKYCTLNNGGTRIQIAIHGVGDQKRSAVVNISVGAPSMQSHAADQLRLISMSYIMYIKCTKADMKEWTKDQFISFFNGLDNDLFRIMTKDSKQLKIWSTERNIHRQVGFTKLAERSKKVMEIHSQQECNKRKVLVQLLANGEEHIVQQYDKIAKERIGAIAGLYLGGEQSPSEDDLINLDLRYQIQIGIGGPVDLHSDFPPELERLLLDFDMKKDIVCFSDGRDPHELNRVVPGWRKVSYTKKRFPFINEKSLTLHLLIQRMVDLKARCDWSAAAHGNLVASLLGDGTLYRIGYGSNCTLRLVETYTQDNIRAVCNVGKKVASMAFCIKCFALQRHLHNISIM